MIYLHFVDDVSAHSLDLSLGRFLFHLHCVDDWLDLCVQNLFNDSLGPVMRRSAVGTVCSQLAA